MSESGIVATGMSGEPEPAVPHEPKRSALVYSHQDLELWLEESHAADQKISLERQGLIRRLFEASFKLLASLLEAARRLNSLAPRVKRQCQNELERLFLWGDGFGAANGRLDDILDKSTDLKINVILLLSELGRIIADNLFKSVNTSNDKVNEELADLQILLETAEAVLQEDGHPRRNSNDFSDSEGSEYDFNEGMEDLASYTDCLMDLAPALERPAMDVEFKGGVSNPETFQVPSALAANYCRKIRDRFPSLDIKMVEKFGEANQKRSQRLHELFVEVQFVPTKAIQGAETLSESLFSQSGGKNTGTTKSTFVSDSIFSTDQKVGISKEDRDEVASQTTFATFSTAFSTASRGIPRVPPLPESARSGVPFKCLACGRLLNNIRNRRAWKEHIFNDLQPYVCTFVSHGGNCVEMFSSRSAWAKHETGHLESAMQRVRCPFCPSTKPSMVAATYSKHVARHLREISLAVLPQSHDVESDSEGDSASSKASDTPLLHAPEVELRSLSPARLSPARRSPARSQENLLEIGLQPPETTATGVIEENSDSKKDSLEKPGISDKIEEIQPMLLRPIADEGVVLKAEAVQEKESVKDAEAISEKRKALDKPETKLLSPRYKTGKTLGAGSYSVVKECVHIDTGRYYAAKVINKRLMAGREHMVRNEIAALKKVSMGHRNIITLVDYFETLNNLYLVTDLALGGELFDRICRKGNYSDSETRGLIRTIISAVAYLHDHGIVHRDLKPENLLFRTPEDNADLLIADFALSRTLTEEENSDVLRTTCGTPGYMAPEIFKKVGHGKPVDMWAIGVITYFLLCGYTPFDRDANLEEMQAILVADYSFTPIEYWRHTSEEARHFIKRCLTIDPSQRITAHEASLHPFLQESNLDGVDSRTESTERKNFDARRTWKVAIYCIRAVCKFRERLQS